jgi:hypothetical protein
MRSLILLGAVAVAASLGGCATTDEFASACERDYARNRAQATAAGALVGGALGAAVDDNDARGAAIGAAAGAVIGNQLSKEDDPCGYGFGGYNRDRQYGYYDSYGRWHWS